MQGIIIENQANLYKIVPIEENANKETLEKKENSNEGPSPVAINCQKGEFLVATARGRLKKDDISPVVGDFVEFEITEEDNKRAVIDEILERKVYVKRPKIANITQIVLVVSSKNPKPDLLMLDKQLAFSEFLGIKSVIVLNKTDLDSKEEFKSIKNIYENIGYKVIETEAKNKKGVDKLKQCLRNNINAFSGNSGVGKSTLINGLFNTDMVQEGEISKKNKRGKNTTTAISLYKIDEYTYIADTPRFFYFFN